MLGQVWSGSVANSVYGKGPKGCIYLTETLRNVILSEAKFSNV